MTQSTYYFSAALPREILLRDDSGRRLSRENFFAWLWQEFAVRGLVGVHEGTMLSEDAAKHGLETDSWTVDSGEAPRERDWVQGQSEVEAVFYFATENGAESARAELTSLTLLTLSPVSEQKAQDWDAQWKAAYLASDTGVAIPPWWRIVPPWFEAKLGPEEIPLKINPGAGFGTGTHETTQLCLQAIAEILRGDDGAKVLDFGSGSGILSIGAALLKASVQAVEIDPLANDNARENARLNEVESRIDFRESLDGVEGPFDLVVANILKPVLLEFAAELVSRLKPGGSVVLSGLIEADVLPVSEAFGKLLGAQPEVRRLNEWRALIWMGSRGVLS